MTDRPRAEADDALWPSAEYRQQVETLRVAIGETVYLVELVESAIHLAVHISGTPHVLLGVIDFPRPDPGKGLTPHLILLDDGRGVNLGRVVRIGRCPFAPAPDDLLYLDRIASQNLLFAERRLSPEFIAQRSHLILGQRLGYATPTASMLSPSPETRQDERR
jgi:hypothetical protein